MSIPTLCQACYTHYRSTVVKACPFCRDVQFPEQVLCDLVREGQSEKQPFRCAAFRPALAVVRHDESEASPAKESSEVTVGMSPRDKWLRAYAVQQLSFHPATLILRSTGIEPRFELKALHHEGEQVIPTGKDHIPH